MARKSQPVKKPTAKQTAAQKRQTQNRREIWALVCIFLAIFSIICCFNTTAFLIRPFASLIAGLFGQSGRYILPLALIATVICLVLAFPIGYFLSRLRVNKQHIMLMLVMLPMWMNFLLRTYAWMGLLSINGPVNAVLGVFGLGPYNMLNTSGAVVLGMVYNYVPYMILPLYTSMTKIDQSIVEAAQHRLLAHRPVRAA